MIRHHQHGQKCDIDDDNENVDDDDCDDDDHDSYDVDDGRRRWEHKRRVCGAGGRLSPQPRGGPTSPTSLPACPPALELS